MHARKQGRIQHYKLYLSLKIVPGTATEHGCISQEKLKQLEAESHDSAPAASQTVPGGPTYLQWRGETYTVFGERLKARIQCAAELAPALDKAQHGSSPDEQLAVLEKLIAAFSEAKGIVRHSLATSSGMQLPLTLRLSTFAECSMTF